MDFLLNQAHTISDQVVYQQKLPRRLIKIPLRLRFQGLVVTILEGLNVSFRSHYGRASYDLKIREVMLHIIGSASSNDVDFPRVYSSCF